MSQPAVEQPIQPDPTGQTVTLPPAPPRPAPQPVTLDLNDPAVQAAIEKARQQEKEKLYPELTKLREQQEQAAAQLAALTADREEREKREQEAIQAAAAAAEEKRQAELSFSERLAETENRLVETVSGLQQQLQQRDVILEKERQYTELMTYRNAALTNDTNPEGPGKGLGPQIMPELRDFVTGNSVEEIEASISALAQRSASILQNVVAATGEAVGQARQQARGVGITAPPVGPMDNNSGHQTVTADEIRDMDMATYAQNRGRLLGAASQSQRDKGMFG